MPTDKNFKRSIRDRMQRRGERYTVARAALAQQPEPPAHADIWGDGPLALHVHARRPWREAISALPGDRELEGLASQAGATSARMSVVATARFEPPLASSEEATSPGGPEAVFRWDGPAGLALATAFPRGMLALDRTRTLFNSAPGSDGQIAELDTFYFVDVQRPLADVLAAAEAAAPARWQLDIDLACMAEVDELAHVGQRAEAALRERGLDGWLVQRVYGAQPVGGDRPSPEPDPDRPDMVPLDEAVPTGRPRPDTLLQIDHLEEAFPGLVVLPWGSWRFTDDDGITSSTAQFDVGTRQVIVSVSEQDEDPAAYAALFANQDWLPVHGLGDEAYVRRSADSTTVQMRGGPLAVAVFVREPAGDHEVALPLARSVAARAYPT